MGTVVGRRDANCEPGWPRGDELVRLSDERSDNLLPPPPRWTSNGLKSLLSMYEYICAALYSYSAVACCAFVQFLFN